MICISIEGTAHTFAVSVLNEEGQIFADIRDMYKTESGGIIPVKAAQHHKDVRERIIKEVIEKSKQKKFDLVAYSMSPGLPPTLKVALETAKDLAKDLNCSLIGVNHSLSHLTHGKFLTGAKDPIYVYCSGANTQIISLEGKKYRIFGEALSIALGNALDKFGREMGLGFPPGPKIEELAKNGKYVELPYTVKGMDVEFSGIITKAIDLFKKGFKKEDLCFSLQETLFAMLTEITERALAHTGKNEVLLIGGVAANKRLCDMLNKMCNARNAKFYVVPKEHSGDNANMIGYQGMIEYKAGRSIDIKKADIRPYERVDEISIFW